MKLADILKENNIYALYHILNYVYSFSNERKKALHDILMHKHVIEKSLFVIKLPINLKVYRWFDFIENEYSQVVGSADKHELNFQPVSL